MATSSTTSSSTDSADDHDQRPEVGPEEIHHALLRRRLSALAALASAEHSAMTADARAIGLVR